MSHDDTSLALKALTDWWGEMGVEADAVEMRALRKAATAPPPQAKAASPAPDTIKDDGKDRAACDGIAAKSILHDQCQR